MFRPTLIAAALASVSVAVLAGETITYSYDARGRLTKAAHSGTVNNGVVTSYGLDKADNRISVTTTGGGSGPAEPPAAGLSFELPEVGASFAYNPTLAGFTFVSNAGIAGNGSAWGFAAAPDGDQVAFLQSVPGAAPGAVQHTLTGLTGGGSYRLSFSLAQRPGFTANPVTVRADGVSLGTFMPGSTHFERFTTPAFQASGTTATIGFSGGSSNVDAASGLDAVTIIAAESVKDSFELPEVGASHVYNPTLAGFTFASYSGVAGNGSAWGFAAAPDGDQVAFLQSVPGVAPGSIRRTIAGLTSGGSYRLSFFLAQRPGFGANPVVVRADGVSLGTFTPASGGFAKITTPVFRASGPTATIDFSGNPSSTDAASGLDAVTIVTGGLEADSFELPEVSNSHVYNPTLAGFTFISNAGIAGNGSAWGFAAPDGDQVVFLQSVPSAAPGTIRRTVTGLTSGASYRLSFRLAQRPGFTANPVTVRADGVSLGTFTPSSTSFEQVTTQAFQASASTATFELSGSTSSSDAASGLDVLTVVPQ